MKQLKEMNYFELLDLEAWCDNMIEKIGRRGAGYYVELKQRASAAIFDIGVNRCLEQFWAEKQSNNNNQKENN